MLILTVADRTVREMSLTESSTIVLRKWKIYSFCLESPRREADDWICVFVSSWNRFPFYFLLLPLFHLFFFNHFLGGF